MTIFRNNLTISQNGIDFIKAREALRLHWYLDEGGLPTIGYGHLMNAKEQRELVDITEAQAEELLKFDLRTVEIYLNANIRVPLTQNQFDALVSFGFNVGVGALEPDRSTLRRLLDAGDYQGAANQFLRWNKVKVNGQYRVSNGLSKRRAAERALFLGGQNA